MRMYGELLVARGLNRCLECVELLFHDGGHLFDRRGGSGRFAGGLDQSKPSVIALCRNPWPLTSSHATCFAVMAFSCGLKSSLSFG